MQPYLFPYIGYFQLMHVADKFVIYDDVNFINRGWINRNRILVNKKPLMFTVPLKNASQNTLIKDLKLANIEKWKQKYLRTLEFAYKKVPYFDTVLSIIYDVINIKTTFLRDWHLEALNRVINYLEIDTRIVETSSKYNNNDLKAQNRILDICAKEKAENYINPIGGIELYNKQDFYDKSVDLFFLKSKDIHYKQFGSNFYSCLSIIDVMMFNSVTKINKMIEAYELV
jgi:hypothetical protein